jgi:hypothetical protein
MPVKANSKQLDILAYEAVRHLVNGNEAFREWSKEQKDAFLQQLLAEVEHRQQLYHPLILKSVGELIGDRPFLVEKYQRGYKWTRIQVGKLLDDIDSFVPGTHGDFYCLQPLVVSHRQDSQDWELIDGQQRLTTIYLILSYLGLPTFELEYKTRHGCTGFLKSMPKLGIDRNSNWQDFVGAHGKTLDNVDNVDNYHFFRAWQTIDGWFAENPDGRQTWAAKLLQQTKVIWYNAGVGDREPPTSIFMRINSGKIALTNAELVKALFLKTATAGAGDLRREIAQEWDRFEQELQHDGFWYFLTGKQGNSTPNRIELLFDICARKPDANTDDLFFTFNHFAAKSDLSGEWNRVKQLFLRLKDWFEDDQTYHLIGFLVAARIKSVGELARDGKTHAKSAFTELLRGHVRSAFARVELNTLRYGTDNRTIDQLLLLFNVLKSMAAGQYGNRFPFDRYVKERWSLEHIHAQHSQELDDDDAVKALYVSLKPLIQVAEQEAFDDPSAKSRLKTLSELLDGLNAEPNKRSDGAKRLIAELRLQSFAYFGDGLDESELDSIDNLALLDRDANSTLNNAIFPLKRKKIREFDRQGRFIPAGTKDVFMKYYSDDVTQMSVWGEDDRAAYLQVLKATLQPYLPKVQT